MTFAEYITTVTESLPGLPSWYDPRSGDVFERDGEEYTVVKVLPTAVLLTSGTRRSVVATELLGREYRLKRWTYRT